MATKRKIPKGAEAEEALRSYFNSIGYFSVRGIPFEYSGYMLTDVDLWLYLKGSSISRTRAIVDIKNKRIPQAMERIFWTKGLQQVLGLDSCVVATTDKRFETIQFGRTHDVVVLDGEFMHRVLSYGPEKDNRITEEEFVSKIDVETLFESNINFKKEYEGLKKLLLSELNFNGCNLFLNKIRLFLQEYQLGKGSAEAALRLFYITISYFLISLDFVSRSFAYREANERSKEISEGMIYGESGKGRVKEITRMAVSLVEKSTAGNLFIKSNLQEEINRQLHNYRAEMLVEHFTKSENLKSLFDDARYFEERSFSKSIIEPRGLCYRQKGIMAVMCDFFSINRKEII